MINQVIRKLTNLAERLVGAEKAEIEGILEELKMDCYSVVVTTISVNEHDVDKYGADEILRKPQHYCELIYGDAPEELYAEYYDNIFDARDYYNNQGPRIKPKDLEERMKVYKETLLMIVKFSSPKGPLGEKVTFL